jgi:hypothetical protein
VVDITGNYKVRLWNLGDFYFKKSYREPETEDAIRKYIRPRFREEMKKLGIPDDILVRIRPYYWEGENPFFGGLTLADIGCYSDKSGKPVIADIRMGPAVFFNWGLLMNFYHEMKHLEQECKGKRSSELLADIHAYRMFAQESLKLPFEKIRELYSWLERKYRYNISKQPMEVTLEGEDYELLVNVSKKIGKSEKETIERALETLKALMDVSYEPGVIVIDKKRDRRLYMNII